MGLNLWSSRTFSAADGEFPAKSEEICLIHICLFLLVLWQPRAMGQNMQYYALPSVVLFASNQILDVEYNINSNRSRECTVLYYSISVFRLRHVGS